MIPLVIQSKTDKGQTLQATYLPEGGMNLISLKLDDIEVIDQSTKPLYDERFAGLGALIGPHFHHRRPEIIPSIEDESIFPHIAKIKAKGIKEPFSHGIGRYVPWKVEAASDKSIKAILTGKDVYKGVSIASLEGQNFKMIYEASATPEGLAIDYSIVSETDSVIGLHYYYAIPPGPASVSSRVINHYNDQGQLKLIPASWKFDFQQRLSFDLSNEADYGFQPFPSPLESDIQLCTTAYQLHIHYSCDNAENSWQLYHPKEATFSCIEPMSAKEPRKPQLTVSSLRVLIRIDKYESK